MVPFSERLDGRTRGKTETNFWRRPQTSPFGTCRPNSQSVLTEATPSAAGGRRFSLDWSLCASRLSSHPRAAEAPGAGNRPRARPCLRSLRHWPARGPAWKGRGRGCRPPPPRTEPPGLFPANNAGLTQRPQSPPRTAARTSPRGSPLAPQVPTGELPAEEDWGRGAGDAPPGQGRVSGGNSVATEKAHGPPATPPSPEPKCSRKTKPVARAEGGGHSQAERGEVPSSAPQQVTPEETLPCCTPLPRAETPGSTPETFGTTKGGRWVDVGTCVRRGDGTRGLGERAGGVGASRAANPGGSDGGRRGATKRTAARSGVRGSLGEVARPESGGHQGGKVWGAGEKARRV